MDSGAEESVWPISLLEEIPTLKILGKKKVFLAANCQDAGHHGREEEKFGDAGDAKMLPFEVTDVTKRNEAQFEAENFILNAKGGKIPMRKKGGSYVIDIEVKRRRERS